MTDIERIIDKFTVDKPYLYKTDRGHLAEEIEQYVIKARIKECQDWLDYFKAQDDDQRIYLLENHFEKHITELKKGLNN